MADPHFAREAGVKSALRHPEPTQFFCVGSGYHEAMTVLDTARAHGVSVTDASRRGLPAIVAEAEQHPVLITRRDQEAVVVIGADRLAELDEAMADMMDLALVVARAVTDTGKRYTLTDVMAEVGMSEEQILALPDDEDDILLKARAREGSGA